MKLLIPYFSKKNLVRQIVGFDFNYVTLTTCRLSMTNKYMQTFLFLSSFQLMRPQLLQEIILIIL